VLVLRGVEHLSQSETEEMLKVSETTLETHLYRARAKLRMLLGED
jgi:DNA-directed RNA polymerase specialized sigma24 family protein